MTEYKTFYLYLDFFPQSFYNEQVYCRNVEEEE